MTPAKEQQEAEQRIAEIAARVEKATAGPWHADAVNPKRVGAKIPHFESYWYIADCNVREPVALGVDTFDSKSNAAFVAHSRDDIPWLLEQLAQARAALAIGPGGAHE